MPKPTHPSLVALCNGDEKIAVRRDDDVSDVGGGLCRESLGLGFQEIGDGDTVSNGRDEESVVRSDDISIFVRSSQEVLKLEIHDFWQKRSPAVAMGHSVSHPCKTLRSLFGCKSVLVQTLAQIGNNPGNSSPQSRFFQILKALV